MHYYILLLKIKIKHEVSSEEGFSLSRHITLLIGNLFLYKTNKINNTIQSILQTIFVSTLFQMGF